FRPETLEMRNRLLYPVHDVGFSRTSEEYGDLSVVPSVTFWYGLDPDLDAEVEIEEGTTLILGLQSISDADERGLRTAMCTLNGQLRPVTVRDRSIDVDVASAEKADPSNAKHVAVPFAGVVTPAVEVGDVVEAGQS